MRQSSLPFRLNGPVSQRRNDAALPATAAALLAWALAGCGASRLPDSDAEPSPPWVLDAGDLRLAVADDRWGLSFQDADGDLVLREASGTGIGPVGALGLHLGPPSDGAGLLPLLPPVVAGIPATPLARETGWARATGIIDSGRTAEGWTALLSTTSPAHRIRVNARVAGEGVLSVDVRAEPETGVQAVGIGFDSPDDERFFGFGERGNAVNQAGNTLEHYVGEGPYQDEEYPAIIAVVPKWGIRWRRDATYFPMPWLLSSKGYGVLIDNDELSYHRLRSSDVSAWSLEVEAPTLRLRVFAAPTPAQIVGRMSAAIGRQPDVLPDWIFGPWVQTDNDARIDEIQAADVPVSVREASLHYLPCGDHVGREQEETARTSAMHARGLAMTTYFNPMICADFQPYFDDAEAAGALTQNVLGQTYLFPYTTNTVFLVTQFDFSTPAAVAEYRKLTDLALAHGHDGWMEDFGEYTPLDAVARGDGATGTRHHNRYPRDYHCAVSAATAHVRQPLARFVRSGWTGSAACSPTVWGGDPTTGFGFDGLESSIYQALSMGTSGVGIWSSDVGGFFALGFTALSDELLDRWIAFGAFSGLMRTRVDGIAIPAKPRPQLWEPAHLATWRRYAKLRTQLYPYVRATAAQYYATGLPMMRHHVLTDPDDAQAVARDDQYLFGDDLLVAPVYREGATTRELYLPAGRWVEFWRAVDYVEETGDFVLRADAAAIDGTRTITVEAPIDEIPIFVRAGAQLPLLPADVDTLTAYGNAPDLVHLSDRAQQIRVLRFPE